MDQTQRIADLEEALERITREAAKASNLLGSESPVTLLGAIISACSVLEENPKYQKEKK